jgi:electron transport complex protein RnfD
VGAAALVALVYLFGRAEYYGGIFTAVGYELASGSLLFAAFYMATDPVTSPKHPVSRAVFGGLAGALTMLFRFNGAFEQAAPFAILLMNAFAQPIDTGYYGLRDIIRKRRK